MLKSSNQLWIETDNALGSSRGDVDDGFALALAQKLDPDLLITTYGNCSQKESLLNTTKLFSDFSRNYQIVSGATHAFEKLKMPKPPPKTIYLGLGPLTTLASQLNWSEKKFKKLVLLGGRPDSKGLAFPVWPHEFNFSADGRATKKVFSSKEKIELITLDQASRLRLNRKQWESLPQSPFPFKELSKRWLLRNLMLKARPMLILWDVVAVGSLIWPELYHWQEKIVECNGKGRLRYSEEGKKVNVLQDYEVSQVLTNVLNYFKTFDEGEPSPATKKE